MKNMVPQGQEMICRGLMSEKRGVSGYSRYPGLEPEEEGLEHTENEVLAAEALEALGGPGDGFMEGFREQVRGPTIDDMWDSVGRRSKSRNKRGNQYVTVGDMVRNGKARIGGDTPEIRRMSHGRKAVFNDVKCGCIGGQIDTRHGWETVGEIPGSVYCTGSSMFPPPVNQGKKLGKKRKKGKKCARTF